MKKNDLIALLESVPGNPEVGLWNGLVQDWVPIHKEIVPVTLVSQTPAYTELLRGWRHERNKALGRVDYEPVRTPVPVKSRRRVWNLNPFVTLEDIKRGDYDTKKIFLIQARLKGETYEDRCGKVDY